MKITKHGHKRNRLIVALLLPALALIWLVGWSMYWIGHQKEGKRKLRPKSEGDDITLIAAQTLEEEPPEVSASSA